LRRAAIQEAGGWQGDTLAEDMDLSLRMQSIGWRARYLVTVTVPGELPSSLQTWRVQQFRWAKGFAGASRKLIPIIWRSQLRLRTKVASMVHLGSSVMGSAICVGLITLPVDLILGSGFTPFTRTLLLLVLGEILLGGIAQVLFGQSLARGSDPLTEIGILPSVAWFHLRVAFSNARGIVEAFIGRSSAFVRTPKRAGGGGSMVVSREDH
jgi:cellulose synthase/poly-beta-1,6-N-acetylglucosamine synthase-like glycosyltransferase